MRKNVSVETASVNQLLIYITQKTVDATIIWEDMASWAESQGKIKTIAIDNNVIKTVPSAITKKSENKELAEKFNKYLKERKDICKSGILKWLIDEKSAQNLISNNFLLFHHNFCFDDFFVHFLDKSNCYGEKFYRPANPFFYQIVLFDWNNLHDFGYDFRNSHRLQFIAV